MRMMILTVVLLLGLAGVASARDAETVTLRGGQLKKAGRGDITIKFVSVVEDSRCPPQSACVWAGNARVQVVLTDRHGSKTVTMNTNTGNHGDQYGGWAINLVSLSQPRSKLKSTAYNAVFSVTRLQR